jgi:hypothetical protein
MVVENILVIRRRQLIERITGAGVFESILTISDLIPVNLGLESQ